MTKMRTCSKCGKEYPATKEFFKPHKNCEDGLERVCKNCVHEREKAYREAHKEEASAYGKMWRQANPEKVNEYSRVWQKENPEKRQASIDLYFATHKELHAQRVDNWQKNNYERTLQNNRNWRQNNKPKNRYYRQQRKAIMQGLPATFTVTDWQVALDYFAVDGVHCCAVCRRSASEKLKLAQDHWIPVIKGGPYSPSNIVPLCHGRGGCNNSKSTKDFHKWLLERDKKNGTNEAEEIERRIADYFKWVEIHITASSSLGSEAE